MFSYVSFLDWIEISNINWDSYRTNIFAAKYFYNNRDSIDWRNHYLSFVWFSPSNKTVYFHESDNDVDDEECEFKYMNQISSGFSASFLVFHIEYFPLNALLFDKHASLVLEKYITTYFPVIEGNTFDHWAILSQNVFATRLLELNPDKIRWDYLCYNPHEKAIHLLENNPEKINWSCLSKNYNAIHLVEKNIDKINWSYLSSNKNAIHLLEKYPDKIDWDWLSKNENAIHLLEKNQDKIHWEYLSRNSGAIDLLRNNQDKINWEQFSQNPSIHKIVFDYDAMKVRMNVIKEELITVAMHPVRLQKWINMGGNIDDF
jgi:hypothetical protein